MEAVFYHGGKWYDEQPMLIGPMNHAFWMASVVFDGARSIRGLVPDVEEHCARLITSARDVMAPDPDGPRRAAWASVY